MIRSPRCEDESTRDRPRIDVTLQVDPELRRGVERRRQQPRGFRPLTSASRRPGLARQPPDQLAPEEVDRVCLAPSRIISTGATASRATGKSCLANSALCAWHSRATFSTVDVPPAANGTR